MAWWRLYGVFVHPSRTFESLDVRPNWFLPLFLSLSISTVTSVVALLMIGTENILRTQLAATAEMQTLPPEQIEEMIEELKGNPLFTVTFYALPGLGAVAVTLLTGVALLAAVSILGKSTTFVKSFSVATHGYFCYCLIYSFLALLVILLTAEPARIDLQNPIYSHLGFLVDRQQSPALFALASSLDLIAVYVVVLLGMGLSRITPGLSTRAGVSVVMILWLLYISGKTSLVAWLS